MLAVDPEFSENGRDDSLLATIPNSVEIHRVKALPSRLTKRVGVGNLSLRCLPYLRMVGNRLLSQRSFDLVFFSTSVFPVMSLGPIWRKRYGVPYVLDFQDPWLTDYYERNSLVPPGGQIKYALSNVLGRILEPRVVRDAAHIVVVSPAYTELLRNRYPELKNKNFTVLPFAAADRDFEFARGAKITNDIFSPEDGCVHWIYAGVAGAIMERSIRSFLTALRSKIQREPSLADRLKVHFIGTSYAESGRAQKSVEPMAAEFDLVGIVEEQTNRLPFLATMKLLMDADALLIFGSDDPSYAPSKIFPYIMARKPLLVVVHEQSPVAEVVRKTRAGTLVTFDQGSTLTETAVCIEREWFERLTTTPATDWKEFEQYTAYSMTASLCSLFAEAISPRSQHQASA